MRKSLLMKISFLVLVSFLLSAPPVLAQKTGISNTQRPTAGKAKRVTGTTKVPVPKDWVYMYDKVKGYGFYLPEGSTGGSETMKLKETTNVFSAVTPAPSEVVVIVLAYKNKKLTKDDLLDDAVDFLEESIGATVEAGELTAETEDYALADAITTDESGKKMKVRILVGTDITDNYVMIVGTLQSKFEANKDIIDAIWGSFEMWSGGASGKN